MRGQSLVRTRHDRFDFAVEQATHLPKELRVTNRLGEHAYPTTCGRNVGAFIELQSTVDVSQQTVPVLFMVPDAAAKAGDQLLQQCHEQVVLVLEMVMYEAGRDASLRRDRRNRGAGKTVFGEDSCEGRHQLGATLGPDARSSHSLVV